MEKTVSVVALARQAAKLIPPAPEDDDVMSYLQWRELVWGTAVRIGAIAGERFSYRLPSDDLAAHRVTADHLLRLAAQSRLDSDSVRGSSSSRAGVSDW